jgi:hypothetical protein
VRTASLRSLAAPGTWAARRPPAAWQVVIGDVRLPLRRIAWIAVSCLAGVFALGVIAGALPVLLAASPAPP